MKSKLGFNMTKYAKRAVGNKGVASGGTCFTYIVKPRGDQQQQQHAKLQATLEVRVAKRF